MVSIADMVNAWNSIAAPKSPAPDFYADSRVEELRAATANLGVFQLQIGLDILAGKELSAATELEKADSRKGALAAEAKLYRARGDRTIIEARVTELTGSPARAGYIDLAIYYYKAAASAAEQS